MGYCPFIRLRRDFKKIGQFVRSGLGKVMIGYLHSHPIRKKNRNSEAYIDNSIGGTPSTVRNIMGM